MLAVICANVIQNEAGELKLEVVDVQSFDEHEQHGASQAERLAARWRKLYPGAQVSVWRPADRSQAVARLLHLNDMELEAWFDACDEAERDRDQDVTGYYMPAEVSETPDWALPYDVAEDDEPLALDREAILERLGGYGLAWLAEGRAPKIVRCHGCGDVVRVRDFLATGITVHPACAEEAEAAIAASLAQEGQGG